LSRFNLTKLKTRFVTAMIVAPASLFVIYAGGWMLWVLLAGVFIVAQKEWFDLAKKLKARRVLYPLGGLYICLCFGAFFLIGNDRNMQALLLLVMVISSDVGAYFFGKFIGGPKMAKTISPNKTWAGFGGAMLCPALAMLVFDLFVTSSGANMTSSMASSFYIIHSLAFGAMIGASGQVGDILVSYMKRLAHVKDTGTILPGHGGVLDRIDALLLASVMFILLEYWLV